MFKFVFSATCLLILFNGSLFSQATRFSYSESERYQFEAKTSMTPNYIIHIATLGGLIDNPTYQQKYASMLKPQFKKLITDNSEFLNFNSLTPHPMAVLLVCVPICMEARNPQGYLDYFPDLKKAIETANYTEFWKKYGDKVDWNDNTLAIGKNFLTKFNEQDKKKWAKLTFDVSMVYAHNAADYKREFLEDEDKNRMDEAVLDLYNVIDGNTIIRNWEKIANRNYLGRGYRAFLVNTLEGYNYPVMVAYNTDIFLYNQSKEWIEQTASHQIGRRVLDYFHDTFKKQYTKNPKYFEDCFNALITYYNLKVLNKSELVYECLPQINNKEKLIAALQAKTAENPDLTPEDLMKYLLEMQK